MRVGFVRNVGLVALGLAVAVTAACNDDPLSFDNDATFDIVTNPSSMTVPSGVVVKLATRAVNQGGEPTWAEVTHTVAPACVTVEDDPAALEINPPGLFVVYGGTVWGGCTITLTAGGDTATVAVNNVAGQLRIVLAPEVILFEESVQFEAAIFTLDEPPVPMGPFENSDAAWSSDDDGVASVDEFGVVTGVAAGDATITACWSDADVPGYEACDEVAVTVIVGTPTVTGVAPAAGASFETVTIEGTDFVSAHEVFIDGVFPGNNYSLVITSITPTAITILWPAFADDGAHEVFVGVPPDAVSAGVTFTQTAGIEAEPFEPANDDPGTSPIVINEGGSYIGGMGEGDIIDYVKVEILADGNYAPVVFWDSGQDMDFALYDAGFAEICHSWYSNPEDECGTLALTAGTYWAEMYDYSGAGGSIFNTTYRFEMFIGEE